MITVNFWGLDEKKVIKIFEQLGIVMNGGVIPKTVYPMATLYDLEKEGQAYPGNTYMRGKIGLWWEEGRKKTIPFMDYVNAKKQNNYIIMNGGFKC